MRILAVDDETGALKLLCDAIGKACPNDELHSFTNPEDALSFAKNNPVDTAFLDIRMFGMTGLELAKKLKSTNPRINIVFATGFDEFAIDAIGIHASGYLTKPVTVQKIAEQMQNLLNPPDATAESFFAQTFGNFDFFVNGKPLSFPREKSKELLALLVDRGGATLTTEQIASVLYEEKNYDRKVKNTLMPVIRCMLDTLNAAGAGDIIVKTWGHLAVDTAKFTCDAYDYNAGKPYAINLFKGEYMANYSWAEDRCAEFYWDKYEKEDKN